MLTLDAGHHTLVCQACGAPLRDLKYLPVQPLPAPAAVTHQRAGKVRNPPKAKHVKQSKPRRKAKSLWRKIASEAFDLVEDIFD